MKPVEVTGLIHQITRRTGVDPIDMQMIVIAAPTSLFVTRYLRNEAGQKYINDEGDVAVDLIEMKAKFRG